MEIKLLRMTVRGVKNIDKDITISFTNKTLNHKILEKSNIKVIYGVNGAGKSAIITAIDLYKGLCVYKDFLIQDNYINYLHEIINKKINEFYINMIFMVEDDFGLKVYSHKILINYDKNFRIKNESLSLLKGQSIDKTTETLLYKVEDGFVSFKNKFNIYNPIVIKTANLLNTCTLISLMATDLSDNMMKILGNNNFINLKKKEYAPILGIFDTINFILKLKIYLENEEVNTKNRILLKDILEDKFQQLEDYIPLLNTNYDVVEIKEFEKYKQKINKLTKFLKLFKTDLIDIEIEKKVNGNVYHCNKLMNYGSYKVDSHYESSGIKKLIQLFTYIDLCVKGDIVFIDEFDANISGVFLNKLLEFIQEYGEGQLCFTSHSFEPMDVLKSNSKAIEFLGETGKLITWITNGHYSPRNQYKEGMIDDSPFNIESYDFLNVFLGEE